MPCPLLSPARWGNGASKKGATQASVVALERSWRWRDHVLHPVLRRPGDPAPSEPPPPPGQAAQPGQISVQQHERPRAKQTDLHQQRL